MGWQQVIPHGWFYSATCNRVTPSLHGLLLLPRVQWSTVLDPSDRLKPACRCRKLNPNILMV